MPGAAHATKSLEAPPALEKSSSILPEQFGVAEDDVKRKQELDRLANNPQLKLQLLALSKHKNFQVLSVEQRCLLFDVAYALSKGVNASSSLTRLRTLIGREVSDTPVLARTSSADKTTLQHLHELSNSDLQTGIKREEILNSLVSELARPDYLIGQGDVGACSMASLQFVLATTSPEELTAIVSKLAISGSARLTNGEKFKLEPEALPSRKNKVLSISQRLFQSSALEHAIPTADYNYNTNQQVGADGKVVTIGARISEIARVYSAVTGKSQAFLEVRSNQDRGLIKLLTAQANSNSPLIVGLRWPGVGGGGKHALVLEGQANGRHNLRNNWIGLPTGFKDGQEIEGGGFGRYSGPPRRLDHRATDRFSMKNNDFEQHLDSLIIDAPTAVATLMKAVLEPEQYNRFDTDGDGLIKPNEIDAAIKRANNRGVTAFVARSLEHLHQVIQRADPDFPGIGKDHIKQLIKFAERGL